MVELLVKQVAGTKSGTSLGSFLRATAHREALRVQRPLRSALPFLLGSITVGALVVLLSLYTPCFELSVNGTAVGLVQSRDMVAQTEQQVEAQVSHILNRNYDISMDYSYNIAVASKDHLMSYTSLSEALNAAVPDIKEAYVLTVDGVELGASADKAVLDAALSEIQTPYVGEKTQEVYYANEARITRKYIPVDAVFTETAQFVQTLQQPTTANTVYEVKTGDTVASVVDQFGMSRQDFFELNPNLKKKSGLIEGQIITVEKTLPLLSVCTVDQLSYTRPVQSPVREVKDATLYEGDRKVVSQGAAGVEQVLSKMTYVNGQAQYEEVLSQSVLSQPTETVVAVGTKARPAYYGTGALQWPTSGRITSPFGYRSIFGGSSFHSGMDIANDYGTAICAADSGIVTYVGYKGSYGNLIIIDHGNGMETYYSHSSTTNVSVGQGVSKGEYIAAMGATGRATGNHCHFEVRVGGEPVNPASYLP